MLLVPSLLKSLCLSRCCELLRQVGWWVTPTQGCAEGTPSQAPIGRWFCEGGLQHAGREQGRAQGAALPLPQDTPDRAWESRTSG